MDFSIDKKFFFAQEKWLLLAFNQTEGGPISSLKLIIENDFWYAIPGFEVFGGHD